jgi:hypothetical protein
MFSPEAFAVPTKVHFVSPVGIDVGAVYVNRIVPREGGVNFYFGRLCVATLSDSSMIIGSRQVERSALKRESPFWYEPAEPDERPVHSGEDLQAYPVSA